MLAARIDFRESVGRAILEASDNTSNGSCFKVGMSMSKLFDGNRSGFDHVI